MDNYYADSFIDKLSSETDSDAVFLTAMPLLPDLVGESLKDIENYHNTVKVFVTRTLAIICRKELHFAKILSKRGDKLAEFFNGIDSPNMNHSLRVAYMEFALALVSHASGFNWILEAEVWKKIVSFKTNTVTIFVVRLMYKFAADFLWKLNDLGDEVHLNLVIEFLWKPIHEFDLLNMVSFTMDQEMEDEISNTIEPVLQMLLCVITRKERFRERTLILDILIKDGMITKLYVLYEKIRKEQLSLIVSKLLCYLIVLRVFQIKPVAPDVVYTIDDFIELKVFFFNTMQNLLQRRNVALLLDFCCMCNLIWSLICKDLDLVLDMNGKKIELQQQMLLICLMPVYVFINYDSENGKCVEDERINEYLFMLLNKTCEHTARLAYGIRDLMFENDTLGLILHSVKKLTCLKGLLSDNQANLVFQALFFVLRDYDPTDPCGSQGPPVERPLEKLEDSEQKVLVMTYVMDTVLWLVKHHNINWHASLEVICLNTIVHNILMKRANLTCKFVVAALNVMTMTVRKFLPPNLSLLMESKPGSAMYDIGKLIYIKMHDMHWEVRDSALELLHCCTEIAYIKFPPIQKQIAENKLINLALTIAFNDYQPYVQVSAFKCVGSAIRVCSMWDLMKEEHTNLLEDLVTVLRDSQEGIVRKEVCNVLCEIYQNVKLAPSFKQILYDHMASTAMGDFHWEVQMSALKFCKIVIQSFLTDQGMLDGTFPPVTFSRETRKIVNLNETEIQRRLLKVLDELAAVGCLTVLLKLIHDDNEVDVMDAALAIAQDLFGILHRYKVPDIIKTHVDDPRTVAELVCDIKEEPVHIEDEMEAENSARSDNVIEGILNADDMNLLADIYKKQMNLQNEQPVSIASPKIKLLRTASPSLFVNFMNGNNCKALIQSKREWKDGIRNVSSLLDDVLGLYQEKEDFNSLDCY